MTTYEDQMRAAAQERRQAVVSRAARPAQRRSAETPGSRGAGLVRAQIEIRATSSSTTKEFDGIASAYEAGYEMWDYYGPYTEIVSAGAGAETLARADLDVPLVLSHDSLRRIARTTNGTLTLDEIDSGLHANAPGLDLRDADVSYIVPKLESKLVDEMSFMFRIEAGQWSPDYMEYRINKYDIHRGDVAIVGYGANPATTAELRSAIDKLKVGRALDGSELDALLRVIDDPAVNLREPTGEPPTYEQLLQRLGALKPTELRDAERAVRRELRRRGLKPAMSLHDLLAD